MKACLLFVLIIFTSNTFSQNVSPQFSELKGMEDQSGNTHLLYRIYSVDIIGAGIYKYNSLYHFDISSNSDSLYILERISGGVSNDALRVYDYDHWNEDTDLFIWCGARYTEMFPDPLLQICRFDGYANFHWMTPGAARKIQISNNDDSLVYIGLRDLSDYSSIKSTDGGWNWDVFSDEYSFQTLFPEQDQVLFATKSGDRLFKSVDEGLSYYEVDTVAAFPEPEIIFDQNSLQIYRVSSDHNHNQYVLRISDNKGEPFSWQTKFTSDKEIFITHDKSISGTIYLANKKNIYLSTDYGDNLNLYKSFERNIVGIYKKPSAGGGSNKLYAATKYNIYEITPDSIHIIKSLPTPDEVLNYYPLAVANKWVYDTYGWWADTAYHTYSGITVREVIGDTVMSNGQFYYKLFDPTTFNYPPILLERIDTSSGEVFRYDETLGLPNYEYLIDDLFSEVGDSIWSSRHQYQDYFPFICVDEGVFNKWGIQGPRKIFTIFDLTGYTYSLTKGVGIDSIYSSFDFGENFTTLKGCIIDGIVYGDTTVVSVEDEKTNLPTKFSLSQNYPNPFNPSTTIRFTISELRFTTLKIYDVLGNEISTLVNEEKPAGSYEVEFDGRGLSSGLYFYQLRAGSFIETKKMILLK